MYPKEAGRVQDENVPASWGRPGEAWGAQGPESPQQKDVLFSRWFQGERSKPSPETTKGNAWLHFGLPHFTCSASRETLIVKTLRAGFRI